jgi:hypothetical protein
MKKFKDLKNQVYNCMVSVPLARNCDVTLCNAVWRAYYHSCIFLAPEGGQAVRLNDLYVLPNIDHISRIRRKIQEGGKLLPTNSEVRKKRHINEEEWRKFLGYNPELRTI